MRRTDTLPPSFRLVRAYWPDCEEGGKLRTTRVIEGKTTLVVPEESLGKPEPPTKPVFFNPAAATNRDVSVAMVEAANGTEFCDALAGVGSRGLRVAKEVGRRMSVTLVDFNKEAIHLARRSARLNRIWGRCSFFNEEANSFLHSRFGRDEKYDFVDIDPFGTPAPYLQAAVGALSDGGILSVTATDTAVLCGVYPKVALRRYGAAAMNNSFGHETAVRILLGFCRSVAGQIDIGISPLAAHVTRHYIRVYLREELSASRADASIRSIGYVMECPNCGHTFSSPERVWSCAKCGNKTRHAGPMWTGNLTDEPLLRAATAECEGRGLAEAAKILKSLVGVDDFPPFAYSLERICSSLKLASVPPWKVADTLLSKGFRVHAEPFEKLGLKTDAEYAEVKAAVRDAAHWRDSILSG